VSKKWKIKDIYKMDNGKYLYTLHLEHFTDNIPVRDRVKTVTENELVPVEKGGIGDFGIGLNDLMMSGRFLGKDSPKDGDLANLQKDFSKEMELNKESINQGGMAAAPMMGGMMPMMGAGGPMVPVMTSIPVMTMAPIGMMGQIGMMGGAPAETMAPMNPIQPLYGGGGGGVTPERGGFTKIRFGPDKIDDQIRIKSSISGGGGEAADGFLVKTAKTVEKNIINPVFKVVKSATSGLSGLDPK